MSRFIFFLLPFSVFAQSNDSTNLALSTVPELNASILAKPTFDAYFSRGMIMYKTGDYTGAVRDFTEALSLNPVDKNTYWR